MSLGLGHFGVTARAGAQGDASEVSRGKRVGHVTGGVPMRPTRAESAGERRGTVLVAAGERRGARCVA